MNADILILRQRQFVLWRAVPSTPPPTLVIGQLQPGAPVTLTGGQRFVLGQSAQFPDLWTRAAAECQLTDDPSGAFWSAHPGH